MIGMSGGADGDAESTQIARNGIRKWGEMVSVEPESNGLALCFSFLHMFAYEFGIFSNVTDRYS